MSSPDTTISDDHNLHRSLYHATCFLPAESTCVKSGGVVAATTEMFSLRRREGTIRLRVVCRVLFRLIFEADERKTLALF